MWDPRSGEPYRPSKRQEQFIQIPPDIFEALYGGAAGGGKSNTLMMLPIVTRMYQSPYYHGITFRRTFPQLDESTIKESVPIYEAIGGTYNQQKRVFKFFSGAEHRFSYLERDEHARQHDTAQYNLAMFDELTHFTMWQYLYVTSRVRSSSNLPAFVRSGTNPGNIGHAWVFDRFVKPYPQGGKIVLDKLTKTSRMFIPAKLQDNPYMMRDDPSYINRLALLPDTERKAKLEGSWDLFEGQVFEEFRFSPLSGEPENARHVISPFEIPAFWPRFLAIDWGYDAQTYALWAALSPSGQVYIYREYSARKASIKEWSADIARLSQNESITSVVIDPSSDQNRGYELTIRQMFQQESGFFGARRADNSRISGKTAIHEFLRWRPRPAKFIPPEGYSQDLADRIFRMQGPKAHASYLKLFEPDKPEGNLPLLQIFSSCKQLIEVIPICVYDEKDREDVKEFQGDDPYDTLRYLLKDIQLYYEQEVDSLRGNEELDRVVQGARDQGDLYMRMRMYEHNQKTSRPKPVYH